MPPSHKYLAVQPVDIEPADFTHFDEWDEATADAEIIASWSANLQVPMSGDDVYGAADIVSADERYAVYLGDGFIEIYRMADLPSDIEFETADNRI